MFPLLSLILLTGGSIFSTCKVDKKMKKVKDEKQLVKNLNIDFNDNKKKNIKKIKIINNLGKYILRKTHNELIKII